MSRKTILILLGVLVIALGAWVFVQSRKASTGTGDASSGSSIFSQLFPFGSSPQNSSDGTDSDTTTSPSGDTDTPAANARFVEIAHNPTAGFIAVVPPPAPKPTKVSASSPGVDSDVEAQYPTVRYAEAGTGYIYDANAKGQNVTKVSGTVIARTAQAYFGDNGASVILRYIKTDNKTVATYLGHIVSGVGALFTGDLKGDFLPDNILDLVMQPDGKGFLYLQAGAAGGSIVSSMKTDGSGKKQVFSSSFAEWLLDASTAGTTLTTKAASSVPGYAYSITSGGSYVKLVGGVNGLTTKMSPDGKHVLYSVSTDAGLSLRIRHLKDGSDVATGLATLPEKCTWTADSASIYCGVPTTLDAGQYPDSWYQGASHFADSVWKIAPATGTTIQVSDGEDRALDMTHLSLDAKGEFLYFIDKTAGSLWSFEIAPKQAAS